MRWLWVAFCLIASAALAAPADDGQTAGSRTWTLNQARSSLTITPSDSVDLVPSPTRAVYVGADGTGTTNACDVTAIFADDGSTTSLLKNLAPGTWYPIQVKRVFAAGTTCTQLRAWY